MSVKIYIIELTNVCNEHCKFCYSISSTPERQNKLQMMGLDEWKKAIDNMIKHGAEEINLSGGESTLHPDFCEILEYAKKNGLYITVSTNGSTYNNRKIRTSITNFADRVCLSIEGSNQKIHNSIKQRSGSFKQIMASLKHYYQHYLKKGKPAIKISTVVVRENLKDMIKLGDKIGIGKRNIFWKITRAIPRGRGKINKHSIQLFDQEFNKLQKQLAEKYDASVLKRISFREDESKDKYSPYIMVSSDGHLFYPEGDEHRKIGAHIHEEDLICKLQEHMGSLFQDLSSDIHSKRSSRK